MKNLYLIPDGKKLTESLALIKKYDGAYEYNDFFSADILDDKKRQMEIIADYAKVRSDFSEDTMHGAFLDVTVHSSDKKICEVSELRIRQSMDIAKEMGLRGVVFHTNRLYGFHDTAYLKNWLESNKRFFGTVCEAYPNQFVFMENMFDDDPDALCDLAEQMKSYGNFGVCLDYAHGIVSGTSIEKWVKMLAPYVSHMHINDNDGKNDLHLALGTGQIDWRKFSKEMVEYKINAPVLIEVSGVEKQRASLEFMVKEHIFPIY